MTSIEDMRLELRERFERLKREAERRTIGKPELPQKLHFKSIEEMLEKGYVP